MRDLSEMVEDTLTRSGATEAEILDRRNELYCDLIQAANRYSQDHRERSQTAASMRDADQKTSAIDYSDCSSERWETEIVYRQIEARQSWDSYRHIMSSVGDATSKTGHLYDAEKLERAIVYLSTHRAWSKLAEEAQRRRANGDYHDWSAERIHGRAEIAKTLARIYTSRANHHLEGTYT